MNRLPNILAATLNLGLFLLVVVVGVAGHLDSRRADVTEATIVAPSAASQTAPSYGGWREMLQPGNGRACKFEDGSGGRRPCVWDARHRGNGQGRSVIIDRRGRAHNISHATAHRSLHG